MTYNEQPPQDRQSEKDGQFNFGAAIAIGVSLGLIFGMMLENTAMGIAAGLLLATLANAYHAKKQGKEHANTALAISLGALLLMILLWVWSALGWP